MHRTSRGDDIPSLSAWIKNFRMPCIRKFLAAEEGFEPSQTESESAVLPLHNSAIFCFVDGYIIADNLTFVNTFSENFSIFLFFILLHILLYENQVFFIRFSYIFRDLVTQLHYCVNVLNQCRSFVFKKVFTIYYVYDTGFMLACFILMISIKYATASHIHRHTDRFAMNNIISFRMVIYTSLTV